jgi:hypothetical protein
MVDRILVLGCSGSGKSTLAARLGRRLGLPYLATDDIYWTADWRPTPAAEVRRWVEATVAAPRWILDGNFDVERDLVWARAEVAIWLDLPFGLILRQVVRRNLGWWLTRRAIWGGKRMTLAKAIAGIRHAARSHPRKRAVYPEMLAAFPGLKVIRVRSRRELSARLAELS